MKIINLIANAIIIIVFYQKLAKYGVVCVHVTSFYNSPTVFVRHYTVWIKVNDTNQTS
jgi:hypothetical protein